LRPSAAASCCYNITVLLFCMFAKFSIFSGKLADACSRHEACSRSARVLGWNWGRRYSPKEIASMKRVGTAEMPLIAQPKIWKGFSNWGIAALTGFATASHLRAVAVLAVISFASFLPGFFQIPPVDRDEARFAQATKQMIETGDYVDIRFQDETRYKKPVGIYWLQAAAVQMADALGVPRATTNIALYRIPSLIGAVGAVLLTYWAALAFVTQPSAFLAGLMMAAS